VDEPITRVTVDGVVVGWVEYDPATDTWRARVRGESAGETHHDRDEAVAWVRQQHEQRS
jgi:predicted RNA-binding protein with PUA domain